MPWIGDADLLLLAAATGSEAGKLVFRGRGIASCLTCQMATLCKKFQLFIRSLQHSSLLLLALQIVLAEATFRFHMWEVNDKMLIIVPLKSGWSRG